MEDHHASSKPEVRYIVKVQEEAIGKSVANYPGVSVDQVVFAASGHYRIAHRADVGRAGIPGRVDLYRVDSDVEAFLDHAVALIDRVVEHFAGLGFDEIVVYLGFADQEIELTTVIFLVADPIEDIGRDRFSIACGRFGWRQGGFTAGDELREYQQRRGEGYCFFSFLLSFSLKICIYLL